MGRAKVLIFQSALKMNAGHPSDAPPFYILLQQGFSRDLTAAVRSGITFQKRGRGNFRASEWPAGSAALPWELPGD